DPSTAQREAGVVDRAQPRQEEVTLRHQRGGRGTDGARVGMLEAADQLQQRRLATTAGADDCDHLVWIGSQRRPQEGVDGSAPGPKGAADRVDADAALTL